MYMTRIAYAVHAACEEIGRNWRVAQTLKRRELAFKEGTGRIGTTEPQIQEFPHG